MTFMHWQSDVWRKVSDQNDGAEKLLSNAWIIKYASGQEKIPFIEILNVIERLKTSWEDTKRDIGKISTDVVSVVSLVKNFEISHPNFNDLKSKTDAFQQHLRDLLAKIKEARRLAKLYLDHPADLTILPPLARLIPQIVEDTFRIIGDVAVLIPSGLLKDILDTVISLLADLRNLFAQLGPKIHELIQHLGGLVSSGGEVLGNLLNLQSEILKAILILQFILPFFSVLVISVGAAIN